MYFPQELEYIWDNLPDEMAKVPFRPIYGISTAQVAARAAGTPTTARIKVYLIFCLLKNVALTIMKSRRTLRYVIFKEESPKSAPRLASLLVVLSNEDRFLIEEKKTRNIT